MDVVEVGVGAVAVVVGVVAPGIDRCERILLALHTGVADAVLPDHVVEAEPVGAAQQVLGESTAQGQVGGTVRPRSAAPGGAARGHHEVDRPSPTGHVARSVGPVQHDPGEVRVDAPGHQLGIGAHPIPAEAGVTGERRPQRRRGRRTPLHRSGRRLAVQEQSVGGVVRGSPVHRTPRQLLGPLHGLLTAGRQDGVGGDLRPDERLVEVQGSLARIGGPLERPAAEGAGIRRQFRGSGNSSDCSGTSGCAPRAGSSPGTGPSGSRPTGRAPYVRRSRTARSG